MHMENKKNTKKTEDYSFQVDLRGIKGENLEKQFVNLLILHGKGFDCHIMYRRKPFQHIDIIQRKRHKILWTITGGHMP